MISYVTGSLFQSPAQVLVNTVNTVGVMGKGIALEFKKIYPEMFQQYQKLCGSGKFKIGTLWLYKSSNKWVLNFPTKKHWRNPSRIQYIDVGLKKFADTYERQGIHSIAYPLLGCGHGQLDFESQVQPLMEEYLRKLPIDVFIYPHIKEPFVPEHLQPDKMREWLREEPYNLPFDEVWDDLVTLLSKQNSFQTITRGNLFTAKIMQDSKDIEIIASGTRYNITNDELTTFWQQLRTYGFSMGQIAPSLSRKIYYLVPIFSLLAYVKPVIIATKYSHLRMSPTIGLQVLPAAFNRDPQVTQLSLF